MNSDFNENYDSNKKNDVPTTWGEILYKISNLLQQCFHDIFLDIHNAMKVEGNWLLVVRMFHQNPDTNFTNT